MIAELYRRLIDLGARALVRAGLHANQVTFLALVIGLAACAGFAVTGARVAFAAALLVGIAQVSESPAARAVLDRVGARRVPDPVPALRAWLAAQGASLHG